LAHEKAGDDCEGEDGEDGSLGQDLDQVCGEWLAQVGFQSVGDGDDGVGDDELEEPAESAADG
jgi:hypothetical protein